MEPQKNRSDNDVGKDDVFHEANQKFLSELNELDQIGLDKSEKSNYTTDLKLKEQKAELLDKANEITYSSMTNSWERLKDDMENGHAQRFNTILKSLPDKEFVKVYLKALEFVKPKLIREKRVKGEGEVDTTINIVINKNDKNIDITDIEDIDHEEI